jgi:two-component system sensor histidine kinase HydH
MENAVKLYEPNRKSMLCVDHDAESRLFLTDALVEYELVFAANAFEAITEINRRGFDGYVLDYWLPDWAGPALCREIRKLDPHAPIVFCTAAAKDENRGRALRAGANAYLLKPLAPNELRNKLAGLLSLADRESLDAKAAEEEAICDELDRRAAHARERVAIATRVAARSFERTARIKAYKAFLEKHGTRAHFDRWWPQVFQSTEANYAAAFDEQHQS